MYHIRDCTSHTILYIYKSTLILFIRFNQEHANRTGDKERDCVAVSHRLSQNEGGRKGGSRQDWLVSNVGG